MRHMYVDGAQLLTQNSTNHFPCNTVGRRVTKPWERRYCQPDAAHGHERL